MMFSTLFEMSSRLTLRHLKNINQNRALPLFPSLCFAVWQSKVDALADHFRFCFQSVDQSRDVRTITPAERFCRFSYFKVLMRKSPLNTEVAVPRCPMALFFAFMMSSAVSHYPGSFKRVKSVWSAIAGKSNSKFPKPPVDFVAARDSSLPSADDNL